MKKYILCFVCALAWVSLYSPLSKAAEKNENTSRSHVGLVEEEVHFRVGQSNIDTNFKNNGIILDSLVNLLNTQKPGYPQITITGAASPEGKASYNLDLSQRRALSVSEYLSRHLTLPDSVISLVEIGRDWTGLEEFVKNDTNVPDRSEVLNLLSEVSGRIDSGELGDAMPRLKKIANGRAYEYLYGRYFAPLRETRVSFPTFAYPQLAGLELTPPESIFTSEYFELPDIVAITRAKTHKPFYMALKTNMLLDVALIPSIGAEFYLGRNISIVGNWAYGWWDTNSKHYYWRYYGGDIAVRWWFGKESHRKPLTGHHLGVYGGIFTFDFELGGKGIMGGRPHHSLWDRSLLNTGIEYGYSLPIARRLNIDFTLGIGYIGGHYIKYHPKDRSYIWDSLKRLHWVGPTKAEISLVWLLGRGNTN